MTEQKPLDREALAALIGDVEPATDGLLLSFAKAVRDRREHEHPKWEDLYCMNLSSYMGERIAPVLRRLLDAEAGHEAGFQKAIEVMRQESLPMSVGLLEAQLELDKAENPAAGWLTSRKARLGDFVQCSAGQCSFGEWSSKAEERGWVRRGDGWLCVQCADAADERAEIVARIDAGTWGAPALSYRAQQLLAHIQADPDARWKTGRAEQVYAELGYPKRGRRHNARGDLHELAARDLLTVHGPDDGRFFLLAQPKDGA
ncbi:hypothetical protein ACFWVT_05450 [Streptomyces cyaneofuscatus]|uniref:hypothetical protein n=1 Tax=Streptomyces cyaneofuscatus TaxID=66883 RepID=UPI003667FE91